MVGRGCGAGPWRCHLGGMGNGFGFGGYAMVAVGDVTVTSCFVVGLF
jgi:hypothetical protein